MGEYLQPILTVGSILISGGLFLILRKQDRDIEQLSVLTITLATAVSLLLDDREKNANN